MAIITCPECGGKVSSTADACPHCGFKIKKETDILGNEISKENSKIVIVHRDRTQGATAAYVGIIFGFITLLSIIGLGVFIGGIIAAVNINRNNANSKELIYFDKLTKKFVCIDIKGNIHNYSNLKLFKDDLIVSSGWAIKNQVSIKRLRKTLGCACINDLPKIDEVFESLKRIEPFKPTNYKKISY